MPKARKNQVMQCRYFQWKLCVRGGVYQADGRTRNVADLGRHSLGTRDQTVAMERLAKLDATLAVEHGLAYASVLKPEGPSPLMLADGVEVYRASVNAPEVAGGAGERTWARYRAVFEKFIPFAGRHGVTCWQHVTKAVLQAYAAHLELQGYADRTLYLELTTIKQAIGHLVREGHLAEICRIAMPMMKPSDSPTYCYTGAEVQAIIETCAGRPELRWLRPVFLALACTGLRIGELAALRWTDIDRARNVISITNDPGTRKGKRERRRTKNRRDRSFPIHEDFLAVLAELPRLADDRVFHGPLEGKLNPDVVRTALVRKILPEVAKAIREPGGETEVERGRLHSFRHYFSSTCADANVPMQMVMDWLGHGDSSMVRYYYHQADPRAQQEMGRLQLIGDEPKADSDQKP